MGRIDSTSEIRGGSATRSGSSQGVERNDEKGVDRSLRGDRSGEEMIMLNDALRMRVGGHGDVRW